jgi:NAD(P)H-hydrate epimerase
LVLFVLAGFFLFLYNTTPLEMVKIISGADIKDLDADYVRDSGIRSFDLMERAANAFFSWFITRFGIKDSIAIVCGVGNNGGDGLAISRMLLEKGYTVRVYVIGDLAKASPDFTENLNILPTEISFLTGEPHLWPSMQEDIIIDAVFGAGINRPLEGKYLQLIQYLNRLNSYKISVDLPSGMPTDTILEGEAFHSHHTLSFQFPKLSLLFPEHASYTGDLTVLDIGIDDSYFDRFIGEVFFVQGKDMAERHVKFHRFSHKGDFGKVMVIGGKYGKIGAIKLTSHAALRTGSGLVSCFLPKCGVEILQTALPEVMVESSEGDLELMKEGLGKLDRFDALGIGPGMGTGDSAHKCLEFVLSHYSKPVVVDADGLNILAQNQHLLSLLSPNSILTPHLIEFERLVGPCKDHLQRMQKAKSFCKTYGCILILKGANTLVTLPNGNQYFNSTGTQYMATGGSGDVLTGMLTSLLGQGYLPENAAICGVFHHGLAGEFASNNRLRGTLASDIIKNIPKTFLQLDIL